MLWSTDAAPVGTAGLERGQFTSAARVPQDSQQMTPMLVVFDLDGTLVDSQRDLAESANELLGTYGAAPLPVADITRLVGDGARVLVERVLAAAGQDPLQPDALERFLAIYDRRLLVHTQP